MEIITFNKKKYVNANDVDKILVEVNRDMIFEPTKAKDTLYKHWKELLILTK